MDANPLLARVIAMLVPLAIPAASLAQPPASVAAVGPALGSRIALNTPLRDAAGKPTTLRAIGGGRPLLIVLFRSAAWCPYCQRQLKGLGPVADAARAKGARLIAISYDKPDVLAAFAAKQGLTLPLYSDSGSRLIDALKLRDPQYPRDSFAYGVPYPTTLLIDGSGTVKAKTVERDYKQRPGTTDQIALLGRL